MAFKPLAGDPVSQSACKRAFILPSSACNSFPLPVFKSTLIRLGLTVSILRIFSKTAPPAFTFTRQFPVGASGLVAK